MGEGAGVFGVLLQDEAHAIGQEVFVDVLVLQLLYSLAELALGFGLELVETVLGLHEGRGATVTFDELPCSPGEKQRQALRWTRAFLSKIVI